MADQVGGDFEGADAAAGEGELGFAAGAVGESPGAGAGFGKGGVDLTEGFAELVGGVGHGRPTGGGLRGRRRFRRGR